MTIPYTNEDDDIANDEKEQKSEGQRPTRNVSPIPILTDSHIDWECKGGCFDVSESPSVEVQS
jgi:hypothetical protein